MRPRAGDSQGSEMPLCGGGSWKACGERARVLCGAGAPAGLQPACPALHPSRPLPQPGLGGGLVVEQGRRSALKGRHDGLRSLSPTPHVLCWVLQV